MIFANLIGKFARLKNLVTRGASFETNTGEQQYSASTIREMFGHSAQDSGRRVIGVYESGIPGQIFPADFVVVDAGETSYVQFVTGIAIDTGLPGPPNILHLEAYYVDPLTGDVERQIGTGFFYRKDGATSAETIEINPNSGGRLILSNLPVYADEAAAVIGGEQTGVVYQTATGELRIKL